MQQTKILDQLEDSPLDQKKQIATSVKQFNTHLKLKNKLALFVGLSVLDKNELDIFALMLKQVQVHKNSIPVELVQKYLLTNTHCDSQEDKKELFFKYACKTVKKIADIRFDRLLDSNDQTVGYWYLPSMFNEVIIWKDKETNCLTKIDFEFNQKFWLLIDPDFETNNMQYMHANIEHLSKIKSKYAQRLYLLLSTYRFSKQNPPLDRQVIITMSLENATKSMPSLRDFLGIPSVYKASAFNHQILDPSLKELNNLIDDHEISIFKNKLEEKGVSKEEIKSTIEQEKSAGHFAMFPDLHVEFLKPKGSKRYQGIKFIFAYKDPQLSPKENLRLYLEQTGQLYKAQTPKFVDQNGAPLAESQSEFESKKKIRKLEAENAQLLKKIAELEKLKLQTLQQLNQSPMEQDNNVPDGYQPPIAES